MINKLSFDYASECLSYCPEKGIFIWKNRPLDHFKNEQSWKRWNTIFVGRIAGSPNNEGYISIKIKGVLYKAHRLAWLITFGEWPKFIIDHVNGVTLDNRISNLREATSFQNQRNSRIPITNKSGIKGVSWDKRHMKWVVQVPQYGKCSFVCRCLTLEEAAIRVKEARSLHHGAFANHGSVLA